MTEIIILTFAAFLISLVGTKLTIFSLKKRAVSPDVDVLMGRKKEPALQNGGIAISFALIITLLGADVDYTIILSLFALCATSMIGEVTTISKNIKLFMRFVAVLIPVIVFKGHIFSKELPIWVDKLFAVFFWFMIIQSFRKMEKIEGMLPTQMMSFGVALTILTIITEKFPSTLAEQSLIFAGAGFGFLWWNFNPAKVMAGTIGSVPAGFVAGYLLVLATQNGYGDAAIILPAHLLVSSAYYKSDYIRNNWLVRIIAGVNMLIAYLAIDAILNKEVVLFDIVIAYLLAFTLEAYLFNKAIIKKSNETKSF